RELRNDWSGELPKSYEFDARARRAEEAGDTELAQQYRDKANRLLKEEAGQIKFSFIKRKFGGKIKEQTGLTYEQVKEVIDNLSENDRNGIEREYTVETLRDVPYGSPGITVEKSKYGGRNIVAVYRDSKGKPIARASIYPRQGISSLVSDETSGLYGRALLAVLKEAAKVDAARPDGTWSKYSFNMFNKMKELLSDEDGFIDFGSFGTAFGEHFEKVKKAIFSDKTNDLLGRFWNDESGTYDPGKAWSNIKSKLGKLTDENSIIGQSRELARTIQTMGDMSPLGRQARALFHKPEFWSAAKAGFIGLGNEAFEEMDMMLRDSPLMRKNPNTGKSIGDEIGIKMMNRATEAGPHAERIASKWAETGGDIPYISAAYRHVPGKIVRMTNRANLTFINQLTVNLAENLMNKARAASLEALTTGRHKEGLSGLLGFSKQVTPSEALDLNPYTNLVRGREIADFVNTGMGQAPLRLRALTKERSAEGISK